MTILRFDLLKRRKFSDCIISKTNHSPSERFEEEQEREYGDWKVSLDHIVSEHAQLDLQYFVKKQTQLASHCFV